ncbi:hypothetical protein PV326_010780 [Microctonus aethiopoides]|nr:hypothetical protein PV326_010780 [Microctonus aethiopoides]
MGESDAGKIPEMDARGRMEDAGVSGQGGVEERKNGAASGKEGMELRGEVGRWKRRGKEMLRRGEKESRKRRETDEMGGGEKRYLQKIRAEWGRSEEDEGERQGGIQGGRRDI